MLRKVLTGHLIDRWELLGIILTCLLFLIGTAAALYISYAPGKTREINGVITSFETETGGSSPGVKHFLHVRLENGSVVRAQIEAHVTPKVGRHVTLIATQMPLIKIERFRFKQFNDPPVDRKPLLQR